MSAFSNWTLSDALAHNAKVRAAKEPPPLLKASACDEEWILHDQIICHCRVMGYLYFHGSMAHKSRRTAGEPDFTLMLPGSRVIFVECKKKGGKLSPEQNSVIAMAARLGTKIHVIYSMEEFLEITKDANNQPKDLIP